jgi:hypothetical protein
VGAASGNYIVSVRALSAVLCVNANTLEKMWVMSSEVPSSIQIAGGRTKSGSGKFYNQHHAQETSQGTIILFDNGNSRPASEGGQYSRGLEFSLQNGVATPVWEFVTGYYSFHAGSIAKMPNGNYIVGQSCDGQNIPRSNCNMVSWEVDSTGNAVAMMATPPSDVGAGGYRTDVW